MNLGALPVSETAAVPLPARLDVFPDGFAWGAATAAYQIEGAVDADGRRPSIWDTFSHTPGNVANGDTGDAACDHYRRWRDDVALLRELGLGAYRFSIAWPRIVPDGTGKINAAGLDWYERLVDALLESGIQPWVTLYHWDLPQPLEDAGGWPERATADAFARFAEIVAARLGDRVHTWTTLNEPWCSAFLGYDSGEHAPGRRDARLALAAAHTLLLAHGRAMEVLRALAPRARLGIVLNPTTVEPASAREDDLAAARRADAYHNRWFLDPLFGRGYPADMLELVSGYFEPPSAADLRVIAAPIDVLGVNYYQPAIVRADAARGWLGFSEVRLAGAPVTGMDWVVRPDGLKQLLVRLHRDYSIQRLAVTENGAAYPDPPVLSGRLVDLERTRYIAEHIEAVGEAISEGVPVTGYFVWSLLDNFEWAHGYGKRFGVVHVDYATQRRTVKDSGHWYRRLIAAHRGAP
jgi:beta-glucosidase